MAKPKTPILSLGAKGTLGDSITFQRGRGSTIARKKPIPAQPYSLPQAYQRWLYQDYIAWWHTLSAATQRQWQADASKYHMSGFAYFMRYSLKNLPDLAGYWKLDYESDDIALDSSRNLTHGAVIGAVPVPGLIDGAYYFDGVDDRINLGQPVSLNFTTQLSFMAFVNPQGIVDRAFFSKDEAGVARGWYFSVLGNRKVRLMLSGDGVGLNFFTTNATIPANEYSAVGCRYDGSTVTMFLHGLLAPHAVIGAAPASVYVVPTNVYIGRVLTFYFKGNVDHLIAANRPLEDSDFERHALRRYP